MEASLQARRAELFMSASLRKTNACLYSPDLAAEDVRSGPDVRGGTSAESRGPPNETRGDRCAGSS